MQEQFDPKEHIAKFYFKPLFTWHQPYVQEISGNLYTKELTIRISDFQGCEVDALGYSLENKMNALLPMLRWEKFEKLRDVSGWNAPNHCGYRDGWGYRFVCMNESGHPMISRYLEVLFEKEHEPADERLLRWLEREYANRKELKQYNLIWR